MRNKYDNIVYSNNIEVQLNESLFKSKTKDKEEPKIKFNDEINSAIYQVKSVLAEVLNDVLSRYRHYFNLLKVSEIANDYDKLRYSNRLCLCIGELDDDLSDNELSKIKEAVRKLESIVSKKMPKGYKIDIRGEKDNIIKFFIIVPGSVSEYIEEAAGSVLHYLAEKCISQIPDKRYIKPISIEELDIQMEMTDVTDMIEIGSYNAINFSKYVNCKDVYVEFAEEVEEVLESINSIIPDGYVADVEGSWEEGAIVIKEGLFGYGKKKSNLKQLDVYYKDMKELAKTLIDKLESVSGVDKSHHQDIMDRFKDDTYNRAVGCIDLCYLDTSDINDEKVQSFTKNFINTKLTDIQDIIEGPFKLVVSGEGDEGIVGLKFVGVAEESTIEEGVIKDGVEKLKQIFNNLKQKIKEKFSKKGKAVSVNSKEFDDMYKHDMLVLAKQLRDSLPEENKIEIEIFDTDITDISSSKNIAFGKYDFREFSKDNPDVTFEKYAEHVYKIIEKCYNNPSVKEGPYRINLYGGKVDGFIVLEFKLFSEDVEDDETVQESLIKELIKTAKNYYKNRKENRLKRNKFLRLSDDEFEEKYLDDLISNAKKLYNSLDKDGYISKYDDFEGSVKDAKNLRRVDIGYYDVKEYSEDNFRDENVLKDFYAEVDKKVGILNSQINGPFNVIWDGDWDDGIITVEFDIAKAFKDISESVTQEDPNIPDDVYNFAELILAVANLVQGNEKATHTIKDELNRFFTGSKCTDVVYTNNTDGTFFGLYVQPFISISMIDDIIYNDNKSIDLITEYRVEIDSKLLNLAGALTIDEITAIILNDVSRVLGSDRPLVQISNAYQIAQANLYSDVSINSSTSYLAPIHRFAISRSVKELTSIFSVTDEEFISDEMAIRYKYNGSLESAFDKLKGMSYITLGNACPCTLIKWACTVTDELTNKHRGVFNMIDEVLSTSGSKFEKEEFMEMVTTIERQNRFITESFNVSRKEAITESFFKKVKIRGLRAIEDDLYEYSVRVKNVEYEADAIAVLRGINYRINMLEEYLISKPINGYDKERCQELINKFRKLRETLMEVPAYKERFIGLFVDAPVHRGQLMF